MDIIRKIVEKQNNLSEAKIPTIAFLGDSVTQGCFDVYEKTDGSIETFLNKECAYHNYITKIFNELFPNVPINIINAGISGGWAESGYQRLKRDVLDFNPDLVVVSFGLNDCGGDVSYYTDYLGKIFDELKAFGCEVIFMTENMMNTYVSCHIKNDKVRAIAEAKAKAMEEGILDKFFDAAKETAKEHGVRVCDVYSKWKRMHNYGVDTTNLLANHINHPTEKMNWLFAYSLVETMFE